jgi:hypothetical protein
MQMKSLKMSLLCGGLMVVTMSPSFCSEKCPPLKPTELANICRTGSQTKGDVTLRNLVTGNPMNCDKKYAGKVEAWGIVSKSDYKGVQSDGKGNPDPEEMYCLYAKKTALGKDILLGREQKGEEYTEARKKYDFRHMTVENTGQIFGKWKNVSPH